MRVTALNYGIPPRRQPQMQRGYKQKKRTPQRKSVPRRLRTYREIRDELERRGVGDFSVSYVSMTCRAAAAKIKALLTEAA